MVDYKHLTDEDIKKFADDLYKGNIFTDRHIKNPDDVPRVFMSLAFLEKEQIEELNTNPPGLIYEYIENAGHMAINGLPIFWSFKILSKEDTKKVTEKYLQIKEVIEKI